jgi:hypothetical protein
MQSSPLVTFSEVPSASPAAASSSSSFLSRCSSSMGCMDPIVASPPAVPAASPATSEWTLQTLQVLLEPLISEPNSPFARHVCTDDKGGKWTVRLVAMGKPPADRNISVPGYELRLPADINENKALNIVRQFPPIRFQIVFRFDGYVLLLSGQNTLLHQWESLSIARTKELISDLALSRWCVGIHPPLTLASAIDAWTAAAADRAAVFIENEHSYHSATCTVVNVGQRVRKEAQGFLSLQCHLLRDAISASLKYKRRKSAASSAAGQLASGDAPTSASVSYRS